LLAGLSTGIGGLLCLLLQGNPSLEVPVTAFMLAAAASAMITVSMCDLFMDIAKEIGLNHTLMMSITGALTVVLLKKIGNALFGSSAPKVLSLIAFIEQKYKY
jgi:zinc transporter ZupT